MRTGIKYINCPLNFEKKSKSLSVSETVKDTKIHMLLIIK